MDGRRKSRTQVSLVARYRSPTVFEFVEEQCFDLSEGGMFIKSQVPAPAGTLLKIECQVGGGPEQIAAVARVVWLRDADSPDGPRGMGVKFVKLENGSNDVIAAVLTRASVSLPPPAPPANTTSAPPPAATKSAPPPPAATTAPSASKPPQPIVHAPTTSEAKDTPNVPAAPSATSVHATTSRPSNATAPATSSPETKAIIFAVLAIVGLIVFASRGTKDKAPEATEPAPLAAPTPEVQAPAAVEAAATPVEAPVAAPIPVPAVEAPVEAPPEVTAAPEAPTAPTPAPIAAATTPAATTPAATTAGMVYVVNVVTTPRGAIVSSGEQRCSAPCSLRFTELTSEVKINAEKAAHNPTATTVNADAGFVERDGALHKTLYLKLHPQASVGAAATPSKGDAPPKEEAAAPPAAEPQ